VKRTRYKAPSPDRSHGIWSSMSSNNSCELGFVPAFSFANSSTVHRTSEISGIAFALT
jgi:hypothetical protein